MFKDYEKYRWFYTSSGKLVVGGKNAEQNEILLKELKVEGEERIMMHTTDPGSPFTAIIFDPKLVKESDIKECAIFTGSFSRAWRSKKKRVSIDIFTLSQLYKSGLMKSGTWGVKGEIRRISVNLELVLTKQNNKLRAVPQLTSKSRKDILLTIIPGKSDKDLILPKLQIALPIYCSQEELLNALPSGGIKIKISAVIIQGIFVIKSRLTRRITSSSSSWFSNSTPSGLIPKDE